MVIITTVPSLEFREGTSMVVASLLFPAIVIGII
jgi:hypothetical protein